MYRTIMGSVFFTVLLLAGSAYSLAVDSGKTDIKPTLEQQQAAGLTVIHIPYTQNQSHAFIPQVQGMEDAAQQALVNAKLQAAVLALGNSTPDSSLHGKAEVSLQNGKLLGIHFQGDSYTARMAHPVTIDCGVHIDLATGQIYTLQDLFKPGTDIAGVIKDVCQRNAAAYRLQIDGLWDQWTYAQFADAWTLTEGSFLLQEDSLRVYAIPFHAAGPISGYRIPYAAIIDSINTDGPLWQQLKGMSKSPQPIVQ